MAASTPQGERYVRLQLINGEDLYGDYMFWTTQAGHDAFQDRSTGRLVPTTSVLYADTAASDEG